MDVDDTPDGLSRTLFTKDQVPQRAELAEAVERYRNLSCIGVVSPTVHA